MLRIALIIALLTSLLMLIGQFSSEPLPELRGEQAKSRSRTPPLPGSESGIGHKPPVPEAPEVYDGYLFNEERKLEEGDFGEFADNGSTETAEATTAGLEQVYYSGSVIVGDRRQGVVSYQESSRGASQPSRASRPAGRSIGAGGDARSGARKKVLSPGDQFMGYRVAAVDPDKIVFEKGGEKIEKFLFDQHKKRAAVSEISRSMTPPDQLGPNGGESPPMAVTPTNVSPVVRTSPVSRGQALPQARRPIRSRRVPRSSTSSGAPTMPVPAARSPRRIIK